MARTRYGFIGTSGLVIMLGSGTFACLYGLVILWKFMHGLTLEQSFRMLLVLFLGSVLPYIAGWMMFRHGKKVGKPRRE